jgi:hypothetical protein
LTPSNITKHYKFIGLNFIFATFATFMNFFVFSVIRPRDVCKRLSQSTARHACATTWAGNATAASPNARQGCNSQFESTASRLI